MSRTAPPFTPAWYPYLKISLLPCVLALLYSSPIARAACLEGTWKGHWIGCTDGLKGTVKARITKCDATHYKAIFTGRAFKVMPYRYTAILTAHKDPETGNVHFKCTQKLPIWGCYWMRGTATKCKFTARYHTDDHVGKFTMVRQ
jgi:hypothetical protein